VTGTFAGLPEGNSVVNGRAFQITYRGGTGNDVVLFDTNRTPVLAAIDNQAVDEESALTFTATATDPDSNVLSFSLIGAPTGAAIDATTGAFTWTPTEAQGPGSFTFSVRVTDNGTPALFTRRPSPSPSTRSTRAGRQRRLRTHQRNPESSSTSWPTTPTAMVMP
jgi:hypothetical protein